MEARAVTKYIRISPRKMRFVIDAIRRKPVSSAFAILEHLTNKGARLAAKTLKSAQANAKVKKMVEDRLFIREIKADGGPSLKRFMSRSMGRADQILKRTTHLTVVLGEREMPVSQPGIEPKEGKAKGFNILKKEKKTKAAVAGAAR
ncbi:MAG: 50S ribosomal protein L22 [Omnitrophica bacterium RIFCSPHIGHO2_02_FULL_46_11]|nr:MAG: 50S ribosomal protein L22 [Omnitrophica bacterium RIFCSPHIGHO2_02_FULL_46_11]OGW86985.1 MAG: 50S ribosomal protein L22 [Omnitrophica bacterium RIFCSPLOWO2_01_FULL_45_10b]